MRQQAFEERNNARKLANMVQTNEWTDMDVKGARTKNIASRGKPGESSGLIEIGQGPRRIGIEGVQVKICSRATKGDEGKMGDEDAAISTSKRTMDHVERGAMSVDGEGMLLEVTNFGMKVAVTDNVGKRGPAHGGDRLRHESSNDEQRGEKRPCARNTHKQLRQQRR